MRLSSSALPDQSEATDRKALVCGSVWRHLAGHSRLKNSQRGLSPSAKGLGPDEALSLVDALEGVGDDGEPDRGRLGVWSRSRLAAVISEVAGEREPS